MAKKIKIKRKKLKEPDEFLSWTEEMWEWLEENYLSALGMLAAGIAVLLVVHWGIRALISAPDPASGELARAMEVLQKPIVPPTDLITDGYHSEEERMQAAFDAFLSYWKRYEGKPAAEFALIYLGRLSEEKGDDEAAQEYYERLSASQLAEKNSYFRDAALVGKGRTYLKKGEYDQALENFEKVMESNSPLQVEAMLGAARCYFALGQKDKAEEILTQIQAKHGDSWSSRSSLFLVKYWEEKKKKEPKVEEQIGEKTLENEEGQGKSGTEPSPGKTYEATEPSSAEPKPEFPQP